MRTKAITIWILTSLTFISLAHFVEAISVVILNNPIRLPQVYPVIGESLASMSPIAYFYLTAVATAVLWGITCLIAFHNPVEAYMNKHKMEEADFMQKSDLIYRMCETIESDHHTLTQLRELLRSVQGEVKERQIAKQAKLTTVAETQPKPSQKNADATKVSTANQKTQKTEVKNRQKLKLKKPVVNMNLPIGKKRSQ
jgi:hypothetical protein